MSTAAVHLLVRVIRGRVLHQRDLVAKPGSESNGWLHAGVLDEPNDDQPLDAVLLELQVEIGVCETAGAPMFLCHNITRLRLEPTA